jgi:hypothetical protein
MIRERPKARILSIRKNPARSRVVRLTKDSFFTAGI